MKSVTHATIGMTTYVNYIILTKQSFDIVDIPICLAFSVLPDIDVHSSKISQIIRKAPLKFIQIALFSLVTLALLYAVFIKRLLPEQALIIVPVMVLLLRFSSKNKTLKKVSLTLAFLFIYYIFSKYTHVKTAKNIFLLLAILPFFSHRGFSHSILALVLVALCLSPLKNDTNLIKYYYVAVISFFSHIFLGDIFTKEGVMLFYPISKYKISFNVIKSKALYKKIDYIYLLIYLSITLFIIYAIYFNSSYN